jgi:hypothetical protein
MSNARHFILFYRSQNDRHCVTARPHTTSCHVFSSSSPASHHLFRRLILHFTLCYHPVISPFFVLIVLLDADSTLLTFHYFAYYHPFGYISLDSILCSSSCALHCLRIIILPPSASYKLLTSVLIVFRIRQLAFLKVIVFHFPFSLILLSFTYFVQAAPYVLLQAPCLRLSALESDRET